MLNVTYSIFCINKWKFGPLTNFTKNSYIHKLGFAQMFLKNYWRSPPCFEVMEIVFDDIDFLVLGSCASKILFCLSSRKQICIAPVILGVCYLMRASRIFQKETKFNILPFRMVWTAINWFIPIWMLPVWSSQMLKSVIYFAAPGIIRWTTFFCIEH
jgi:hypothetical protein